MNINEEELIKFPVFEHLDNICQTLKESKSRCLVVTAETGAGKSTILPLGLLKKISGNIIMTEPRRLSVLGTSSRIAELMNENCGETSGYRIRLENKISKATRLQVVTEAVLVRMLQEDFALEKFNVVVLDEFHERSVSLDLICAFLKEALEVRDDLYVVVMSATMDAKKISAYFNSAPVISVPGRTFPVSIEYKPGVSIEAAVISEFNKSSEGSILVFLPGLYEIKKCTENLRSHFNNEAEVLMLHSSISMEEQKKILKADKNKRRIIVSSAIAETSLTVPDITVVVDSGFCRMNVFNLNTGMEKLVTVAESEFSAAQRTGRAGRTREGRCVRLWSQNDVRQKEVVPEILRSNLAPVVLECAERGEINLEKINFIDKPSENFWNESLFFLERNGMVLQNKITPKGSAALKLGTDLRLAGLLLSAGGNEKLLAYVRSIFFEKTETGTKEWNDVLHRLEKIQFKKTKEISDKALLLLEGYGDRLAQKISSPGEKAEYQFTSGRKGFLHNSCSVNSQWIIALEADAGESSVLIFKAEEISGAEFDLWLLNSCTKKIECYFKDGKIIKEEQTVLEKLVLSAKKLIPEASDIFPAWKNEILKKGFKVLPLDSATENFLLRVKYYRQQKGETTDLETLLCYNTEEWLAPFLTSGKNLDSRTVYDALYWYLNGSQVDKEVPSVLEFPNGRKFKVLYEQNEKIRPVVQVIIQRVFGCFSTPQIMGQKVLLKLLSPASRPLQITDDLENFWKTSWVEICKEMKGRYPKHNWDYRVQDNND